ncbi:MAG: tetratricopeptide repeat protein [Elusimicrobiota bacterium]
MENANRKEVLIAYDREIFLIFLIFSFLLYALYPKDKLAMYAINEDKNYDLTELYLRNMYKKYPQNTDLIFALCDVYIKQKKFQKAIEIINEISNINDTEIKAKSSLYLARIKLYSLDPHSDDFNENLLYLKKYYSSSDLLLKNSEKEKILEEYSFRLMSMGLYKEAFEGLLAILNSNSSQEYKEMALKQIAKVIRAGGLLKEQAPKLSTFENIFLKNDESANIILKIYLEVGRVDLARAYALKILKAKKII